MRRVHVHVPEPRHESVQVGRAAALRGVHCRQWTSRWDGPSERTPVFKANCFVLLKYLIRGILHSRKYVCVGFLRSPNEVISNRSFKLRASITWYFGGAYNFNCDSFHLF